MLFGADDCARRRTDFVKAKITYGIGANRTLETVAVERFQLPQGRESFGTDATPVIDFPLPGHIGCGKPFDRSFSR